VGQVRLGGHFVGICDGCVEKVIDKNRERIQQCQKNIANARKDREECEKRISVYQRIIVSSEAFEAYCAENNEKVQNEIKMKEQECQLLIDTHPEYKNLFNTYKSDHEKYMQIQDGRGLDIWNYIKLRDPSFYAFRITIDFTPHHLLPLKEKLIINAHSFSEAGMSCMNHAPNCL